MIHLKNFLNKREQSQARLSFAKREKSRLLAKSLLTLVALFAISTGAWAQTTVKYALTSDLTISSGTTVEVKDGTDVVATITYSETGGSDFTTKATTNISALDGYTAYTEGNEKNGDKTGGTFYTIVPAYDGTIDVAVILSASKPFYILEDGTALTDYNGITKSDKYYGTFSFAVSKDKAYKLYCSSGKLGFYGFEYTFGAAAEGTALTPDATRKVWTLDKMPAGNVELQVEYYPGMLVKPTNLVGGTMEIEGLTDTTLPEGFEKDDDGNIYVAKDTKFTVKAVPAEGYHLVGWSDDAENKELEREFTMGDDDFILTATFSDEYDLAFNALNANTIEDGKATVKVGDTDKTATLIQDGKLSMKSGQTVTLTAAQGYKFRSVEAKKTGSAVTALAPALENGATVVIICNWGYATTTFTYTNNGGTFSGQVSGYDANYFYNGLELNGKNLSFGAANADLPDYLSVGITFNTESSAYSYTGKGGDFVSFTISVNGTDVTSQLSELK